MAYGARGHISLHASLMSPADPYGPHIIGGLGGAWPLAIREYRLDDRSREAIFSSRQFVMPCLSMERVSDLECIVEMLLRSGADQNILPRPEDDCSEWLWARVFRHTLYPQPCLDTSQCWCVLHDAFLFPRKSPIFPRCHCIRLYAVHLRWTLKSSQGQL